jgi:hypothetical protein
MARFSKSEIVTIDANDLISEYGVLSVKIVGIPKLMFKLKIAIFLIRFAGWILGTDCEILESEEFNEA